MREVHAWFQINCSMYKLPKSMLNPIELSVEPTPNDLFSCVIYLFSGSLTRLTGRLLILSGKTGEVLQWVETPDGKESYYSPQILTGADGTDFVLFGTGGETHGGGLYSISLNDLYNGITKNVNK